LRLQELDWYGVKIRLVRGYSGNLREIDGNNDRPRLYSRAPRDSATPACLVGDGAVVGAFAGVRIGGAFGSLRARCRDLRTRAVDAGEAGIVVSVDAGVIAVRPWGWAGVERLGNAGSAKFVINLTTDRGIARTGQVLVADQKYGAVVIVGL